MLFLKMSGIRVEWTFTIPIKLVRMTTLKPTLYYNVLCSHGYNISGQIEIPRKIAGWS